MSRTEIRVAILSQTKPFCISDLFARLSEIDKNVDKDLVLECLDELFEGRLLDYQMTGKGIWAFYVV